MTKREKLLNFMRSEQYKPMTASEIKVCLDVKKNDEKLFYEILEELEKDKIILKNKKQRYKACENSKTGKIHLVKTGAFVECDDEEIFVLKKDLCGAFEKDIVSVVKTIEKKDDKCAEGKVLRILKRGMKTIVGKYTDIYGIKGFEAFDMRLPTERFVISKKNTDGLENGDMIEAKITAYPNETDAMHVCFEKLLAKHGEYGADTECLLSIFDIPHEFDLKTIAEAEKANKEITKEEISAREDFRNLKIITIDGADSKDLDDAVYVEKNQDFYILHVHIADVSHYVKFNSLTDKEAQRRATSVYFPDRVVPMLPKVLSNGICSLNPNEDRLTLSVIMKIDKNGDLIDYKITKGIIKSYARMTYSDVTALIEGYADNVLKEKYGDILNMLDTMRQLSEILKQRRLKQGYISFNVPEIKFVLNEFGKAQEVFKYEESISNEIIEQFMLMANETVARFGQKHNLPFVYRVHEAPDSEKEKNLRDILHFYAISINEDKLTSVNVSEAVGKLRENEHFDAISAYVLRCMSKARYDTENLGHFGLGCRDYLHFTSPIRRYPDLQVHRVISAFLQKESDKSFWETMCEFCAEAASFSSEAEMRSAEAQREADKLKACEYMQQFVGSTFEAVVCSITDFGMFVSLPNAVEGFVPLNALKDDYYVYEKKSYLLRGRRTNKTYELGDSIKVRLDEANISLRRIDFSPVTESKKSRIIKQKKSDGIRKRKNVRSGLKKFKRKKKGKLR